jgi:hypothetical protein
MTRGTIFLLLLAVGGLGLVAWWFVMPRESPEARQALLECETLVTTGLDAWKARRPPNSLTTAQPSLTVDDQDWRAGDVLLAYEITTVTFQDGDRLPRCFVKLKLQRRGKNFEREVCYIVDTKKRIMTRDPYS